METIDLSENPFRPSHVALDSDDEYVAKITKSLESVDRWRWLLIVIHVAVLIAVLWLSVQTARFFNPLSFDVLVGGIVGLKVGICTSSNINSLVRFWTDFRKERLLVKYHQRLRDR